MYDYSTCFCDKSTTFLPSVALKKLFWPEDLKQREALNYTDFAFCIHLTLKFVSFARKFPKQICLKKKQYLYTLHEQKQEQEEEKRVLSAPVLWITQDTVHTGG